MYLYANDSCFLLSRIVTPSGDSETQEQWRIKVYCSQSGSKIFLLLLKARVLYIQ